MHRWPGPRSGEPLRAKGGPHRGTLGAAEGEERPMKKSIVRWSHRARLACEAGMTTAEYAVGTLAP